MTRFPLTISLCALLTGSISAYAGPGLEECAIRSSELEEDAAYLTSEETEGRGFGTTGHQKAAFYLTKRFESASLLPLSGSMSLSFRGFQNKKDTTGSVGHNIIGMLEGGGKRAGKYIIIGAYYDGIGILKDKIYPGADANVSSLAAMIQLARSLRLWRNEGGKFPYNVIFVAFDGRRCDRAGSQAFWNALAGGSLTDPVNGLPITPRDIALMIDLDQMGSSLSPVDPKRKDYMIVLGEDSLPGKWQDLLIYANNFHGYSMDLHRDYYGSHRFTATFYNMGDRKVFIQHGIPTLLFTSGITSITNSTDDTAEKLDIPVLRRRTMLIFKFLKQIFKS